MSVNWAIQPKHKAIGASAAFQVERASDFIREFRVKKKQIKTPKPSRKNSLRPRATALFSHYNSGFGSLEVVCLWRERKS